MELGLLAQWMANRGSYGPWEFIRLETFQRPARPAERGVVAPSYRREARGSSPWRDVLCRSALPTNLATSRSRAFWQPARVP